MFHHLIAVVCIVLLTMALSCLTCEAREFIIIDGKKVFVKGIEITCEWNGCCEETLRKKLHDIDYITGTNYVTQNGHNNVKSITVCVAKVIDINQ